MVPDNMLLPFQKFVKIESPVGILLLIATILALVWVNAGVVLNSGTELETVLALNIVICLVLGKSIGITSIILLAKKIKRIEVPFDITNTQIVGVSFLAAISFTMAIFIASLAFANSPTYINSAKTGILIGSLNSAIIGYLALSFKVNK